ncbi:1687_t:CDS:2, partial [Scutellospora calospora]
EDDKKEAKISLPENIQRNEWKTYKSEIDITQFQEEIDQTS